MSTATVTTKGQITIPISVRKALGVKAGDKVEFVELEKGRFVVVAATMSVKSLKGIIPKPKNQVTLENMDAAIKNAGKKAM